MGKISNVTNSSDLHSIKSRVFVGSLNTLALTKNDIHSIFDRYGSISGISMHKGYAFVQYNDEQSARNAVAGEDQRVYAGRQIDVNLSSEPKQNRSAMKRPPAKEWDCYYNVPTAAVISHFPPIFTVNRPYADIAPTITMQPSIKKRLVGGVTFKQNQRSDVAADGYNCLRSKLGAKSPDSSHEPTETTSSIAAAATSNGLAVRNLSSETLSSAAEERASSATSDILICGTCKQSFDDAWLLIEHKRTGCRLQFACKCRPEAEENTAVTDALRDNSSIREITNGDLCRPGSPLLCATCRQSFASWHKLCVHCQSVHSISIYLQPTTCTSTTDATNNPENSTQQHERSLTNSTEMTLTHI